MTRHFLRDDDLSPAEQHEVLQRARHLKSSRDASQPFHGAKAVALIFDKPTLRTQVSFAAGVAELGGMPMVVDGNLAKIGTRESVSDTAKVLGRQVAAIVWRTYGQERIEEMAAHAGVPVVNALTDQFHPCQLLADLLTVTEHKGELAGLKLVFLGDAASNMAHSYLLACALAGKEDEADEGSAPFLPYAVTAGLLGHAKPDAIVLHCLPAYRDKEIATDVIDGPQSVVWDEAENRLHAQKALLSWLLEQSHENGEPEGEA